MPGELRKVTSEKFSITLPQTWRESVDLKPGDYLVPYYEEGSILILAPKDRKLSDLEVALIDLLLRGPMPKKTHELLRSIEIIKEALIKSFEAD